MTHSVTLHNYSPNSNYSITNSAPIKILALTVGALAIGYFISKRYLFSDYLEGANFSYRDRLKIVDAIREPETLQKAVKQLKTIKPYGVNKADLIKILNKLAKEISTLELEIDQMKKQARDINLSDVLSDNSDKLYLKNARKDIAARWTNELKEKISEKTRIRNEIDNYDLKNYEYNIRKNEVMIAFGIDNNDLDKPAQFTQNFVRTKLSTKIALPIPPERQANILSVIRWVEAN